MVKMSVLSEIAKFIKENDHYLLATHVFPDGDNMGCVLALSEGLLRIGKDVSCYIEGPIPKIYTWMPKVENIQTDLVKALAALNGMRDLPNLLVVDSGDLRRIGNEFGKWLEMQGGKNSTRIVNIDHHISNDYFGDINWVDASYSSVGEMIYELLMQLGVKLTGSMAQNLYTSVFTDTGRFSFSNTTAKSLQYAAEYVEAGARPIDSFANVYANRTMKSFKLQSLSFKTLTKFLDGRGFYFVVDRKMLQETETSLEDTEGFLDTVRTLRGFEIVTFFKEVDEGDIRVSVRAAPPINASRLTNLFGGGGHPRAAGCRIQMKLDEAIAHFVTETEKAIESGDVLDPEEESN